jgi:16S rRNA (guanine966-N2)-methyltransferase
VRIVAGAAGGRRLAVPPGGGTRPTSDRAREGLFSAVEAMLGGLAGARVVDLYAGSGAVGLEALSRGARHALLVESHPRAVRVLRANVAAVGLAGAEVRPAPVERVLAGAPPQPYDLAFLDPPYDLPDDDVRAALVALAARWLAGDAVVVVERAAHGGAPDWPPGLVADRSRRYGDAVLWYGRGG